MAFLPKVKTSPRHTFSLDTWRVYFTVSNNLPCHQKKVAPSTRLRSNHLILTSAAVHLLTYVTEHPTFHYSHRRNFRLKFMYSKFLLTLSSDNRSHSFSLLVLSSQRTIFVNFQNFSPCRSVHFKSSTTRLCPWAEPKGQDWERSYTDFPKCLQCYIGISFLRITTMVKLQAALTGSKQPWLWSWRRERPTRFPLRMGQGCLSPSFLQSEVSSIVPEVQRVYAACSTWCEEWNVLSKEIEVGSLSK